MGRTLSFAEKAAICAAAGRWDSPLPSAGRGNAEKKLTGQTKQILCAIYAIEITSLFQSVFWTATRRRPEGEEIIFT
jgi:hypothetical protein